jgi:hypothetical protein
LTHSATTAQVSISNSDSTAIQTSIQQSQPKPTWAVGIGVFLVILASIFSYAFSAKTYFLADDFVALNQLALKQTSFVDNLVWFTRDWGIGANFYRPLVRLGYWFQYACFGDNAAGWHWFSITLHSLNALLVFGLGYVLSRRLAVGTVAGLIFALQSIHTEPVAWISGQTDLWATFFCLLAVFCFVQLHMYLQFARSGLFLQTLALLFFGLALCSKESAITLPLALLAYELIFGGLLRFLPATTPETQPSKFSLAIFVLNHGPFWVILGLYLLLRLFLFQGIGGYSAEAGQAFDLFLFLRSNVRWLMLPFSLSGMDGITLLIIIGAFIALTGVQESEMVQRLQKIVTFSSLRTAVYGLVWLLIFLGPALFVQPAERFTYLPSVGFALFFGAVLAPFFSARLTFAAFFELVVWLRVAALLVVIFVYVAATNGRVAKWVQAGTLAQTMLQNTTAVITKHDMPHYSYIYGENLPEVASGAYLFRTGYSEAIQWLYHDSTLTAYKVDKFPVVEDHLGQTIFLEYLPDGNIVNHTKVQEALQERANNLKKQRVYLTWDFSQETTNSLQIGWYDSSNTEQSALKNGVLNPSSSDISLQNNNLVVPAFQLGTLEITLKASADVTSTNRASATWSTNLGSQDQVLSTTPAAFTIIPDGLYHTYTITPLLTPHNQNGQLSKTIPLDGIITTIRLGFPASFHDVQIQKIVQYQIPSSYAVPLD